MSLLRDRLKELLEKRIYIEFDYYDLMDNQAGSTKGILKEIGDDYLIINNGVDIIISFAHIVKICKA